MATVPNNGDFLGNGWAFPIDGSSGRIAMISDDANIRQSIFLILSTNYGERVMMPTFGCGLGRLVFAPADVPTLKAAENEVRDALTQWEPRISVTTVTAAMSVEFPSQMLINVDYVVLSRNSQQNLVYPFFLETSA